MDATLALAERNEELERVNRALLRKLADRDRRRMELEEVVYKAASDARKGIGPPRVEKPVRDRRAGREEVVCLHFTDWQDAQLQPHIRLAKVNTEEQQGLAASYGIRSIPTLALFSGGREIDRVAGAMDLPSLINWVSQRVGR